MSQLTTPIDEFDVSNSPPPSSSSRWSWERSFTTQSSHQRSITKSSRSSISESHASHPPSSNTPSSSSSSSSSSSFNATSASRMSIDLVHVHFFNDFGDLFDEDAFRTPEEEPMTVTPE